ncbi:hypothetical protein NDU88_003189 [Pleurodeles waltl]|uniref:Uncharacterized protein n=1 Tax=Pleurodeles waltl TaxID=8319 RepID=A0AAV7TQB9_PLEWA|nr:hypothetical protein NDU88_003189 [Pleurodeles waltl]
MEAAAVLALCALAFPHPLHARVLRADEDGFAECSVFFKEQSPQDRAPCYQTLLDGALNPDGAAAAPPRIPLRESSVAPLPAVLHLTSQCECGTSRSLSDSDEDSVAFVVEENEEMVSTKEKENIAMVTEIPFKKPFCSIDINGIKYDMMADSGSLFTLINVD